jgi:hypothetical protein
VNTALCPHLAHLADGGDWLLEERSHVIDSHELTARVSRFLGEGDIALGILDRSQFSENSVTGTERMKRDMAISHSLSWVRHRTGGHSVCGHILGGTDLLHDLKNGFGRGFCFKISTSYRAFIGPLERDNRAGTMRPEG